MSDDPNAAAAVFVMAGLVTPMALRVAATLRLPDHIAAGPRTASELAEAAGADPTTLDRLLRHLATLGIVAGDESGRYRLTDRGEVLRDDHPTGLRRFLEMGSDVAAWAPAIAAAYDWSKLERVTDVGGGNGTLLSALLTEHRGLRGTVVDQPGAAEAARIRLAAAGLSDDRSIRIDADRGPCVRGDRNCRARHFVTNVALTRRSNRSMTLTLRHRNEVRFRRSGPSRSD